MNGVAVMAIHCGYMLLLMWKPHSSFTSTASPRGVPDVETPPATVAVVCAAEGIRPTMSPGYGAAKRVRPACPGLSRVPWAATPPAR